MEALMQLNWLRRPPSTARKTASEMRVDAEIHDKEVELTYLRQIVNIARDASVEATNGLYAVLQVARSEGPKGTKITGEKFDEDFTPRRE